MYPKLFVTFSYYDGYRVCYADRIYSLKVPVRITATTIKNAKQEFYKEARYNSTTPLDLTVIFWSRIDSENDAVDDTEKYKTI